MTYDEDNAWVIWPEYFDKSRSRSQGRRVSSSQAIVDPDLTKLEKAVAQLGLEYKVEKDKAFPSNWWEANGRIRVERAGPKSELLADIATLLS
ncbi:MAG: signal recognition particle subunit SRP19/SEC65 family protein [Candidatus Methanomethylophilaceae archaeon]|nr:signal recognition particle subunit SRP19/SEC65 family protein [Candidatus Methanomethylophilaceae archaeon]